MALEPGTNLGSYRIVEQAGAGGMATVYKAYQPSLTRFVAIKVLPAHFAHDSEFGQRFQREAINVARLRHPNILTVFDYGDDNGLSYIVTEFVDGGTLADQLGNPLPVDYAVRMLRPVASALDYAHALGVVHRDIKPSNILLWRNGTPTLSDFGLAKMMDAQPGLTSTAVSMGTPDYMAPEQAAGEEASPSSDLYALGIIVYQMLTGRVPFRAQTPLAVLLAHLNSPLPLPRQVNPALSEDVEAVLLKVLAKVPADRYRTAIELITALEIGHSSDVTRSFDSHAGSPSADSVPALTVTSVDATPPAVSAAVPPSAAESLEADTVVMSRDSTPAVQTPTEPAHYQSVDADEPAIAPAFESRVQVVASFGRRVGAFLIDGVIVFFIWAIVFAAVVTPLFGDEGTASDIFAISALFLVPLLYHWFFATQGGTLAMQIMGMRILSMDTGRTLPAGPAFNRAFFLVLGTTIVYGVVRPLWDDRKLAWHDVTSSSVVVRI